MIEFVGVQNGIKERIFDGQVLREFSRTHCQNLFTKERDSEDVNRASVNFLPRAVILRYDNIYTLIIRTLQ